MLHNNSKIQINIFGSSSTRGLLASELEHDLGYSKHSKVPKVDNNRRNGSYEKTIIDENGSQITVDVSYDRE